MKVKGSIKKTIEFLKKNPNTKYTTWEIAEWFFENENDWCMRKRDESKQDLSQDKKLKQQISSEISRARIDMQKNHRIKTTTERPRKYYYTESTDAEEVEDVENSQSSNTKQIKTTSKSIAPISEKQNLSEHDLYPILTKFLWDNLKVYSKRIDERKSKHSHGKGGNKWLFPDIVGFENISQDWENSIRQCAQVYSDKKTKLWSFEVKLHITHSNVRQVFFQTVSNSSWANLGYLVANTFDKKIQKELQILCGLHGIGFIELNTESPKDSKIVIHAREKTDVDWDTANRIASENSDFRKYIDSIIEFYNSPTNRIHPNDWDTKM